MGHKLIGGNKENGKELIRRKNGNYFYYFGKTKGYLNSEKHRRDK